MTSRYVHTWKFVKNGKGEMECTIRLRLVPRGFMDFEDFDVDTFSVTARRSSQRLLASTAACKNQWVTASLDFNVAFLKGLTCQDLAEPTGGTRGVIYFAAWIGRALPGFGHYDESKHFLQCLKPGTGTKGAPRALSLKLRRTSRECGLRPMSCDDEFETSNNLLTAKH
eukprot:6402547-Pyramimonas_sp.AAC.1